MAGVTLVELMIGMVVSSIVLLSIGVAVSSIGEQFGAALTERRMKDSISSVFALFERDVRAFGRGIPPDLLTKGPVNIALVQADIHWVYENIFRDINATNAPDQIWFSGAGMDAGTDGERTSFVVDYAAPDITALRMDGRGVLMHYTAGAPASAPSDLVDPAVYSGFGLGIPPSYISILNPSSGFISAAPLALAAIVPLSNSFGEDDLLQLTLQNPGALASTPVPGQQIFLSKAIRNGDGTISAPQHLQQARWYWIADAADPEVGTLYRQLVADPVAPVSVNPTIDGMPVLDNVVDFQVAYLVWPCDGLRPVWTDHLLNSNTNSGMFSGAPFRSGNAYPVRADRLLALRERLMSIRVTIMVREAQPRPRLFDEIFGTGNPQAFRNEDRQLADGAGINGDYRHFVMQQVYDPVSFRVSTSADDPGETFPKVRSVAADNATQDPLSGACTGRKQN